VFRDKHALRELARHAGLRNPGYRLASSPADVVDFLAEAGGRCVLKPTGRQASMGVQILDDPGQVPAAWAAAAENVDDDAPDRGVASQVLAEEFAAGPEHSVELLLAGGRCLFANVTGKRVLPGRYPVEAGHVVPAGIGAELRERLIEATRTLCGAVRFGDGIVHAEWIAGAGEPTLVECAGRIPGGEITRLITLAYGFPLLEAYLDVLLGNAPVLPEQPAAAAAVRFLVAQPGRLQRIDGADAARAMPGVVAVDLAVEPGDDLTGTRSSWDRAGQVIATAPGPGAANAAASAAAAAIKIVS
jgi:biotin carboxylase